jgi:uncharacterized protein (DUF302 family)
MILVESSHKMGSLEILMRRAVQRHGAVVISVNHLGQFAGQRATPQDTTVFAIGQPDLTAALLAADIRFAAFLPCRIAAWSHGSGTTLSAMLPSEFWRLLKRPDLERLVSPLETLLRDVMDEAARTPADAAPTERHGDSSGPGATEAQVNLRGSVPQRIDSKGTKVEDMAGTGSHDSSGG